MIDILFKMLCIAGILIIGIGILFLIYTALILIKVIIEYIEK